MAQRGQRRGNRGRGRARVDQEEPMVEPPPRVHHRFIVFPQTLSRRLLDEYNRSLALLHTRPIEVARDMNWTIADEANLSPAIAPYLQFIYRNPDGARLFTCRAWYRMFHMHEPVYRELVLEFYSTFAFQSESVVYDDRRAITFRLGGLSRQCSVAEFGRRVGLYTEEDTRSIYYMPYLQEGHRAPLVGFNPADFWATIANGPYVASNAPESNIRSPAIRLLHRMIACSIAHRRNGEKVNSFDLFLLWTILTPNVWCNIPYALALYMETNGKGLRVTSPMCCGQFITKLATSYGILTHDVEEELTRLEPRYMSAGYLESMDVIERFQGGYIMGPTHLEQQGAPEGGAQRGHRRRRGAQPAAPFDFHAFADAVGGFNDDTRQYVLGMGSQVNWMTSTISGMAQQLGYAPQHPPPPPPQPYPDWRSRFPQIADPEPAAANDDDDDAPDDDE